MHCFASYALTFESLCAVVPYTLLQLSSTPHCPPSNAQLLLHHSQPNGLQEERGLTHDQCHWCDRHPRKSFHYLMNPLRLVSVRVLHSSALQDARQWGCLHHHSPQMKMMQTTLQLKVLGVAVLQPVNVILKHN